MSQDQNFDPEFTRGHSLRRKQSLATLKAEDPGADGVARAENPVSFLASTNEGLHRASPMASQKAPIELSRRSSSDEAQFHDSYSYHEGSAGYLVDGAAEDGLAAAGINLTNSTDTMVHTKVAPAVTKETITPVHRNIRAEVVTREIHNYDVYHRIQPIKEVEVLPTRHFIRSPSGAVNEVPASSVPGITGKNQNWQIVETVSKETEAPLVPRKFTARPFKGTDGDYVESTGEDGVKRSHMTCIHPPTLQSGAERTGQSVALHLGKVERDGKSMPGGWYD